MNDNNLGNFFDAENFKDASNDSNNENWKPVKVFGNELFKKGIDILNVTRTICDVLPADDEAEVTKRLMLENAMTVPAKIKGAQAIEEVYSLVMESAVIIKVNICQLNDQLWTCHVIHEVDQKYLDVLKDEIKLFKKIFIQWVSSFDKGNDLPDEWHLFNDPATFPNDDEPFNAREFMENFDSEDDE